jgi:hypothetical protein
MRKHVTAVAVFHIGLGILGVGAGLLIVAVTFTPDLIAYSQNAETKAWDILAIVGFVLAGLLVLPSLVAIIGGQGLLHHRPWARRLVLVLAVIELFNIPIGTILGLYSMWTLLQDETEQMFIP